MNIVDRRANPKGKSLSNRQRFLGRARVEVEDQQIGLTHVRHPPLRHVQLESGQVGRPDQRGQVVDHQVVHRGATSPGRVVPEASTRGKGSSALAVSLRRARHTRASSSISR